MQSKKPDILSRTDLELFLQKFYAEARENEIIGEKFIGMDLDQHIVVIVDFWDSVIFGSNKYHGDPFGKHLGLTLNQEHFATWLSLFKTTLTNNYEGKNTDEIILRAETIARVFQHKLKLY